MALGDINLFKLFNLVFQMPPVQRYQISSREELEKMTPEQLREKYGSFVDWAADRAHLNFERKPAMSDESLLEYLSGLQDIFRNRLEGEELAEHMDAWVAKDPNRVVLKVR